jgi:hypothetical protein
MKIQHLLCGLLLVTICVSCNRDGTGSENNQSDNATVEQESDGKQSTNDGINSNEPTPVKLIDRLPGIWVVDQVTKGGKTVTREEAGIQNQPLEFTRDGRYRHYSGKSKIDSGSYRVNERQESIYLDSDDGKKITEWNVSFDDQGRMLMFNPLGEKNNNLEYTYSKQGNSSI